AVTVARGSGPQVPAHEDAGVAGEDRGGVGGVDEAGAFEVLAEAGVGHGQVDAGVAVVERVGLDDRGAVGAGESDGAVDEGVGDALLAVAGRAAEAPQGPDGQVVDVGDLAVAGEGGVGARGDGGPADRFGTGVGEYSGRGIGAAQVGDVVAAGRSAQLVVEPGRDAVAQAPADVGRRRLRAEDGTYVLEDRCRAHLDRLGGHGTSLARPGWASQGSPSHASRVRPRWSRRTLVPWRTHGRS